MENLFTDVPALVLRIVAIELLYVVNLFYSSYKYNRKLTGHYASLKTTIKISKLTRLHQIKDFGYLFETLKTDKINFDETTTPEKLLEILKPASDK